jgi:hypothetical protein
MRNMHMKGVVCLALTVILCAGAFAYAENMFGVPATVDSIDQKAGSMGVTYTDPDTHTTKQQGVYWDESTEFIKEGPPPDMQESPAKADQIKEGSKLYVTITDAGKKGNRLRLDAVRIKP